VTADDPEPEDLDPDARPADWTAAAEAAWKAQGWTHARWEAAAADEAQAAYEAMYGTPAEQAADAVEAEAYGILASAWEAMADQPPEPEADL
jgi:hypothetical protein